MRDVPFTDQRTVTDDDFLANLALPGTAGRKLIAARKSGNVTLAKHIVAEHFRTRRGPRWPFYMHGSAWLEIDNRGSTLKKADDLLHNRMNNCWAPGNIAVLDKIIDWKKTLKICGGTVCRHMFVVELSTAFALTGKTAYLRKAFDLIKSFTEANSFVLEEGFFEDHDRYFGGGQNNTLDVFLRSLRWLDFMHTGAFQIPGLFSDDEVFWFMKQLWFCAMQYSRYSGDTMRRDNHHLCDHGHATFVFGTMFPEFSCSKVLVEQGRKTIAHHFRNNIFADGGNAEHCMKYQYHIIYHYLEPLALARANNIRLFSPAQIERIRKWVELNAYACRPNGILTEFGDEHGGSLEYLFDTLATPVMTPRLAALARALGFEPGRLSYETPAGLVRCYRNWKEGTPTYIGLAPHFTRRGAVRKPNPRDLPEVASKQYPHGGWTFFRTGWTKDADYLAVSHYTDSMPHAHAHWDMMSFILHTQGETLIGDPATWLYSSGKIYGSPEAQERRGYIYNMESHNCLVMNDDTLKPIKACGHECFWGGYPPKHGLGLFQAGGPIEVAEIWHDAYAPTRHRRYVVHIKGIGFAFVDLLSRPGLDLRPHQYSQRFHFEKAVTISPENPSGGSPLSAHRNDARCIVIPGGECESFWKTWNDTRLAGIPGADVENGEGPFVAELTRRIEGPAVFTTFLITRPATSLHRPPGARYLGAHRAKKLFQQHDALSANVLDLGKSGTLFIVSCPYGVNLDTPEISTDAELAVVILNPQGSVSSWRLARGSRLAVHGRVLARGRKSTGLASSRHNDET